MSGFPDFFAGDELTAGALAARTEAIRGGRVSVDPDTGLELTSTGRGESLRDIRALPILGKLSGSGSPYSFVQAIDTGVGAIAVGKRSGKAYEVNGVAGLAGKTARLYPDRSGNYRFAWIGRGSGVGGGGGTTPGCSCLVPDTFQMTSIDGNCYNKAFQSAGFTVLPTTGTSTTLYGILLNTPSWASDESFPDPIVGYPFRYIFSCTGNTFSLRRIYANSPIGFGYGGGPFINAYNDFTWTLSSTVSPPNQCSPFELGSGTFPAGGATDCPPKVVSITGGTVAMAMLAPTGFSPASVSDASPAPAVRDLVLSCPDRGPEGGLTLLESESTCCGGGAERTACSAGRGAIPGRVTLRECLACAAERLAGPS